MSNIKSKLLPCQICGRDCNIRSTIKNVESEFHGKKACAYCREIHKIAVEKPTYSIPKQSQKNKEKRKTERTGYGEFFLRHIETIKQNKLRCMECGCLLFGAADNVCHILSKSKSPEVALVDENILYLCSRLERGNQCHAIFDNNLDSRQNMRIFPVVVETYRELKPLLKKSTKESEHLEKFLK